jgi:hypothetical protein
MSPPCSATECFRLGAMGCDATEFCHLNKAALAQFKGPPSAMNGPCYRGRSAKTARRRRPWAGRIGNSGEQPLASRRCPCVNLVACCRRSGLEVADQSVRATHSAIGAISLSVQPTSGGNPPPWQGSIYYRFDQAYISLRATSRGPIRPADGSYSRSPQPFPPIAGE